MPHINGFDERQKDMWTVEPVFADWGGGSTVATNRP